MCQLYDYTCTCRWGCSRSPIYSTLLIIWGLDINRGDVFFVHIDPLADATCLLALLKFYIHTVITVGSRVSLCIIHVHVHALFVSVFCGSANIGGISLEC